MMSSNYEKAKANLVYFDDSDVVRTSTGCNTQGHQTAGHDCTSVNSYNGCPRGNSNAHG